MISGWDSRNTLQRPWRFVSIAAFLAAGILCMVPESGQAQSNPLKDLETKAQASPSSVDLQMSLGLAYLDSGRIEEARACFQRIGKLDRNDMRGSWGLALALMAEDKYEDAKSTCRAMTPRNGKEAQTCLGYVFIRNGRGTLAEEAFNKALASSPGYAPAQTGLGDTYLSQTRVDDAMAAYQKALSLDPKFGLALLGQGQAHLRKGDLASAALDLKQAVLALPGWASPYLHLGRALGDKPGAVEAFRTAILINPDFAEAFQALGQSLVQSGKSEEGIQALRKAVELEPKMGMAHFNLGLALWNLKRPDEADPELMKAVELIPNLPQAHETLGDIDKGRSRFEDAVVHYQEALRQAPGENRLNLKLGESNMGLGKNTLAWSYLDKAANNDPKCSLAYSLMARMACGRREFDRGQALIDKALAGDGKGVDSKQLRDLKSSCVSTISTP